MYVSHQYNTSTTTGERIIFVNHVLLGNTQNVGKNQCQNRFCPDKGYHSMMGVRDYQEYIVYRFGQAKPFLLIYYK